MPTESFLYPETKPVLSLLEEAARRSGVSRGQAFEDFLLMSLCALSGVQLEEQYLGAVSKHTSGPKGKRGCDSLAQAFAVLVDAMEKTRQDILGDLFQGGITYGEAGQFLTPESVCGLMAQMTMGECDATNGERKTVCDPCCGSGRMLLAVGEIQPHWEFVGQDIDLRCVRMTAINLALRNRYGYVIWGNSLGRDRRLVYRTGFNLRGFVRGIPLAECPGPVQQTAHAVDPMEDSSAAESSPGQASSPRSPGPGQQLHLF